MLFKILYFLNMTLFGPLASYLQLDSTFGNFIGVYFLPICTLYLNGRKAFFLQITIQVALLHLFYKSYMIEVLETMSHVDYAARLTSITGFGVIINSVYVI